jgi:hypothetical protein
MLILESALFACLCEVSVCVAVLRVPLEVFSVDQRFDALLDDL